jgi:hypothetical protein
MDMTQNTAQTAAKDAIQNVLKIPYRSACFIHTASSTESLTLSNYYLMYITMDFDKLVYFSCFTSENRLRVPWLPFISAFTPYRRAVVDAKCANNSNFLKIKKYWILIFL